MPIIAADLILYAAAAMLDVDSGAQGGAIDLLRFVDFAQLAADDDLEVVSDSGADTTMDMLVEVRQEDGTVESESVTLNGTTAVIFSTLGVVERVLKAELDGPAAGVVTLRRSVAGATIRDLAIGKRGFIAFHRKTTSNPTGGGAAEYYTKCFWRNDHATLALLNATVKQSADPSARITHLLANAVGDTATSTDRTTAPGAGDTQDPDTFDDNDKAVPGTDLAALTAIGVWFNLSLPEADSARREDYTTELTGETV